MFTLITGASSGIGKALAKEYAKHGHDLILIARSKEKLESLAREIKKNHNVNVIVIDQDLSPTEAPKKLFDALKERNIEVDILINNAGFGNYGMFVDTDLEEELNMIDLNIKTLTTLTKLFAKKMKEKKSGTILNVASTAAFQPGPLMAVYFATKSYVLHFSEAIANELKPYGVYVAALCPGPTDTAFQDRAFGNRTTFSRAMTAQEVAKFAYTGMQKKKHVIIPGMSNRFLVFFVRLTPRSIVTSITRRMFEK